GAGVGDSWGAVPGLVGVVVVAPEVPEFCAAVGQLEGDDDFEVAVGSGAVVGLDEAGGAGDVVVVAGDSGAAVPGELGVVVVAPEVSEFCAAVGELEGDDDFEVAVGSAAVVGLDEAAGRGDGVLVTGNAL